MILFVTPSDHQKLFRDLENSDKVLFHYVKLKKKGLFYGLAKTLYLRFCDLFRFPYGPFFVDFSITDVLSLHTIDHIVFLGNVLPFINRKIINNFRSKYRCSLFLLDSINAESELIIRGKKLINAEYWDSIYTFDQGDADKYGFRFIGYSYYSMIASNLHLPDPQMYNIYFIGGIKGNRINMIHNVYSYLEKYGCKMCFDIALSRYDSIVKRIDGITYHKKWIPYKESLDKMQHSKVILEILREGQTGQSIRYFEAVCYNKKLLTNNPEIIHYPYYDPHFMKYFNRVEDIDVEWIKEDIDVDYHYKGDFSPIHLLDVL